MFPEYIISENGDKYVPNNGNGENFQSVFKIPTNTFENSTYGNSKYKIYVKETLTK